MDDFREQYRNELINQEIKSNKYTLKGFVWFIVAVAFIWLLTVTGFFEVDKMMVTIAFAAAIILLIPTIYISLKGNLSLQWLKYLLLSLMCIASAVIASFLSYHAVLIYVVPLLFAVQYRSRRTIWFVYAVNTVTMLISSIVSFYYGICDLNLLLQSQHTRSWYMSVITENALNIPFNENPLFIIIVFEVFPRCIILFVFSVLMQYTIVSSTEDAYRIAQLTYLKETDARTKVFNKNKYEEMLETYYPHIENIAVTFWDLNNLKYINDKYGHAMGDRAIESLSSALYVHSNDRRRVYRIGGDEFLMIIDNPYNEEVRNFIKTVQDRLVSYNENLEFKISSAVGMASGKGKDIAEIVKKADEDMYRNKKLSKESREQ